MSGDVDLVPFLVAGFPKSCGKLINYINFTGAFVKQYLSPPEN